MCTPTVGLMNLERLFSLLSSIHPLSDDFKASVEQELTLLSLPKGHLLLEAPKVSKHAWFLDSGFAMSYTFLQGQLHVENFWGAGEVVLSLRSFFGQVPSAEFIKLVLPGNVICINYEGVQRLFRRFPEAHYIYETVSSQYYEKSRERAYDLQHLSARDRYVKLLTRFPQIPQFVAQENIASYVGIAPQSLSRLKRQMRNS